MKPWALYLAMVIKQAVVGPVDPDGATAETSQTSGYASINPWLPFQVTFWRAGIKRTQMSLILQIPSSVEACSKT